MLRRVSKRREISSIVAVTAPLDGAAPMLYARHFHGAIHAEEVIPTLRYLRAQIGYPLILIWDHLQAHRAASVRDFLAQHPADFQVEWLPGYAPELNPEEQCNNCVKLAMLNAVPRSDEELRRLARRYFTQLAHKPHLLTHFFIHAGLSLN